MESLGGTMTDAMDRLLFHGRAPMGTYDLFESARGSPSERWSAPRRIEELSAAGANDESAFISGDGLTVWFNSDRDGEHDVFVARRPSVDDPFDAPAPVDELNSDRSDTDPWVSPDGRWIVFASNRDGASQLYQARR
jgi:Tol biopolymer transport system component